MLTSDELLQRWNELNSQPRPAYFTEDQWTEYGYAEHPGLFRTSSDDTYEMRFNRKVKRPLGTVAEEGAATAKAIASKFHGERLVLMLSGGLDSHFMVKSFQAAEVDFECLIIRHAGGLNSHDSRQGLMFAKRNDLEYRFFDLDMKKLISSGEGRDIAQMSQCRHVAYAPWCKAVEFIDYGIPVSGFNEPEVMWQPDFESQLHSTDYHKGRWVFHDQERFPAFQKFLQHSNRVAVPSFYQYTMELWAAYLVNPLIMRLVSDRYGRRVYSSDHVKHDAYGLRQRIKYTGYERVLTQVFIESEIMRNTLPVKAGASIDIPYFDLLNTIGITLQGNNYDVQSSNQTT